MNNLSKYSPFLNVENNHISVFSCQNKDTNIHKNKDYYYIEEAKLDNLTKGNNKIVNKSIKFARKQNNFINDNIKRKASEQKNIYFKAFNKLNNYNDNYSININNENMKKGKNDNLYNIFSLNNDKKYKKNESALKNNCFINNHKEETIMTKNINKNITNLNNKEFNLNNNKKKEELKLNNKEFNINNNKKDEEENLNKKSTKITEKLKIINKINYEEQQIKNKTKTEKNKDGQINTFKDKNEGNNQKGEAGYNLNQIKNRKGGIRNYYKTIKNKKSKISSEDENYEKNYNDNTKKGDKPKDFVMKNNNLLKQKYTNKKKIVDNKAIEKKLNDCNYIIENINFKIYKKEKFYYIVKNNKIKYSGYNEIPKQLSVKKEINFTIKENGNPKTLYIKKENEINNKIESIQKNSQDNYFKDKNNIIIKQKEFEENKINDNNINLKTQKKNNDESKKFQEEYLKKWKKIYGFRNNGNNCYLNSSLQLLTRINDLKEKILKFNEINQNINTNGQLTKEFKNILYKIENDEKERIISPDKLKRVMANIDERYSKNHQEDSNEFISFFLDALISETAIKNKVIDKIEVYDKNDQDAFNKFYKKFYIKKGYSFILELLYGIIKTEKICKSCKERNFVKFSPFNILDLPIYNLAKSNKNKILYLKEILNNYLSEYKSNGFACIKCKQNEVYTNNAIYTLPKYLIVFFARIVEKEYFYNEIKYPEEFNFNEYTNNTIKLKSNYNYKLQCVIEHSGGAYSGHYTALCRIYDNCWYDFSDSYGSIHSQGFESKNAIILLYQAQ